MDSVGTSLTLETWVLLGTQCLLHGAFLFMSKQRMLATECIKVTSNIPPHFENHSHLFPFNPHPIPTPLFEIRSPVGQADLEMAM